MLLADAVEKYQARAPYSFDLLTICNEVSKLTTINHLTNFVYRSLRHRLDELGCPHKKRFAIECPTAAALVGSVLVKWARL